MSGQTEFVLRQELRTLQIMNDSKSREIAIQGDYVKRLKKRFEALEGAVEKARGLANEQAHKEHFDADWYEVEEIIEQLDKEQTQ